MFRLFVKALLDETRWTRLIEQFRLDMFKLYQMGQQSKFTAVLQSGLSALKTPFVDVFAILDNQHKIVSRLEPVLIKFRL
jgi:hypothetical protein